MNTPASPPRCPACGGATWHPLLSRHGHRYVRCADCPTARLDPMPTPAELSAVFDEGYFADGGQVGGYADYTADALVHARNATARIEALDSVAGGRRGPLVDVGCATGETLVAARATGWQPYGVEVSAWAAERARGNGFTVVDHLDRLTGGNGEDLTGRCRAVTFFQSLEHMPDPAGALAAASRLLAPGGVVVVETWDRASLVARLTRAHWQQVSPPSVLWLFHRAAAASMADRAGLELTAWKGSGKLVGLGFVAGLLAAKYPFAARPLTRLQRGRLGRAVVRYRLGDLVTAVLVKPPVNPT